MRRVLTTLIALTVPAALTLATAPAAWAAPTDAADPVESEAATPTAERPDAARLGMVRSDTLWVELPAVVDAALKRNEMLAAADAMADAAHAEALGAWQGYLPQVTLGEFFMRSDDALSSFGFKLQNRTVTQQDFAPSLLNHPGETNNYITQVKIQQPVFNGGMGWNGIAAANAAARARTYEHRRAREEVAFQAIQAVEGLALAQAYEQVVLATRESALQSVRQAWAMVDAEMATAADLLQAQVYLASVESRLIQVRSQVETAGDNIALLTSVDPGLPVRTELTLEAALDVRLPDWSPDQTVNERADLRALEEQAEAAGKMSNVAVGAMLPHVNLSLERNWYSRNDLFGTDADSWMLGVYGTWDVFKGLANVSALKKARAEARAAEHMHRFETRRARVEAREAWLNARAARERVTVARNAVEAAREGLRIVSNQYREGLATMLDLLDTQLAAAQAETGLVEALHDYNIGLARLRFAGVGPSLAQVEAASAPDGR